MKTSSCCPSAYTAAERAPGPPPMIIRSYIASLLDMRLRQPIVEGIERLHVIGALEGGRLGHRALAHAAPHLLDRLIGVRLHPRLQVRQDLGQSSDAVGEQFGREHGDVS